MNAKLEPHYTEKLGQKASQDIPFCGAFEREDPSSFPGISALIRDCTANREFVQFGIFANRPHPKIIVVPESVGVTLARTLRELTVPAQSCWMG